MKLPKSLTKVTTFSKLLAVFLFFAFLGSAFYAGIIFDQKFNTTINDIFRNPSPIQWGTAYVSEKVTCTKDNDCVLTTSNTQSACCPNITCLHLADTSSIAVNGKWLVGQKQSVCGQRYMCPMIAMMCPQGVLVENAHYSAKCIQHVCQKVKS